MSNTVILTSRNQDPYQSNKFTYTLPSTVDFSKGFEIALIQASVYNSFFNITAARGNNIISIIWNAATPVTYNFTFADGFYSISEINYALQNFMRLNDLYLIDADGKSVYYVELMTNSIIYGAQINTYAIPTAAEAATLGYVLPVGATWNFPTTKQTPQVVISSAEFGKLIGFSAATLPSSILNVDQQYVSNFTPTISVISNIFINTNMISSPYSNPSGILSSMPITSAYGDLIVTKNSSPIYNPIIKTQFNSIEVTLLDQEYNPLTIRDKEVVIILGIRRAVV